MARQDEVDKEDAVSAIVDILKQWADKKGAARFVKPEEYKELAIEILSSLEEM